MSQRLPAGVRPPRLASDFKPAPVTAESLAALPDAPGRSERPTDLLAGLARATTAAPGFTAGMAINHGSRCQTGTAPNGTGPAIRATNRAAKWRRTLDDVASYQIGKAHDRKEADRVMREHAAAIAAGPDFAKVHGNAKRDVVVREHRVDHFELKCSIAVLDRWLVRDQAERAAAAKAKGQMRAGPVRWTLERVYRYLADLWARHRGKVFPSLERIAGRTGIKVPAVHKAIGVLTKLGFLTWIARRELKMTAAGPREVQATNVYVLIAPRMLAKKLGVWMPPPSIEQPALSPIPTAMGAEAGSPGKSAEASDLQGVEANTNTTKIKQNALQVQPENGLGDGNGRRNLGRSLLMTGDIPF